MNDMLGSVIDQGTGRNAQIDRPAAGKTGTSQDWRDAWFVGYTPDLVVGIWSGNDNNKPMNKVAGGHFPARLWGRFMTKALDGVAAAGLPGLTSYNRRVAANAPAASAPVDSVPSAPPPSVPAQPSLPAPVGTAEAAEPAPAAEKSGETFTGPSSTQGIFAR